MAWEQGYGQLCFLCSPVLLSATEVSHRYVSPFDLAASDIVLVTYEILKREVNHANSHEGESQEAFGDPHIGFIVLSFLAAAVMCFFLGF